LVPPVLMPEGEVPPGPLSKREKQERAVVSAFGTSKRTKILH
jgi:hypothetical protein